LINSSLAGPVTTHPKAIHVHQKKINGNKTIRWLYQMDAAPPYT
jgi:hypothetical protein